MGIAGHHQNHVGPGGELAHAPQIGARIVLDLVALGRSIPQPLQRGYDMRRVDSTGTVIPQVLGLRERAQDEQALLSLGLQGQEAVILEQHDALFRGLPGQGDMLLAGDYFGTVCLGIRSRQDAQQKPQNAAHGIVDPVFANLAPAHGFTELLPIMNRVGSFDVQTRRKGINTATAQNKIRVDKALEAPFIFQDPGQEYGIMTAMGAIHFIVGTHHGASAGVDATLEMRKVDLA